MKTKEKLIVSYKGTERGRNRFIGLLNRINGGSRFRRMDKGEGEGDKKKKEGRFRREEKTKFKKQSFSLRPKFQKESFSLRPKKIVKRGK